VRVERWTVDADVPEAPHQARRRGRRDAHRTRELGQTQMKLWRLRTAHLDGDGMASRIARLESVSRRLVALVATRVNRRRRRRLVVAPELVLVRCGPVMVLRMIVISVVVDVQRRGSRGRGYQGKREQGCQRSAHWRESMRRELRGQTHAQWSGSVRDTTGSVRKLRTAVSGPPTRSRGRTPRGRPAAARRTGQDSSAGTSVARRPEVQA
jgi:hypothetical protein